MAKEVGTVSAYYSQISVVALQLSGKLKIGDTIQVKGATTDFTQKVTSMQVEHESVREAKKGDHVGIKVEEKVRPNDKIYKE